MKINRYIKLMLAMVIALPILCTSCKEDDDDEKKNNTETQDEDNVPVQSITLNTHEVSLMLGETAQLMATILPYNASERNVIWSSSDNNVAIVSSDGTIVSQGDGGAIITVKTIDGEISDYCKVSVHKNIIFKDQNLLKALVRNPEIDKDGDKGISPAEALAVTELSIGDDGIASFDEIGYFSNLEELFCYDNQITSLDVSKLTKLKRFHCHNNLIEKLDLSQNPELTTFSCNGNNLTSVDITNNSKLIGFFCGKQKTGTIKLKLTVDQFNNAWKEEREDSDNQNVELVMNIFEGVTIHSDDLDNNLKNGDSASLDYIMRGFQFRLYGADGNELSFYDPSIFEQIVWTSSNESVATVAANYENNDDDNRSQIKVKVLSVGNTIITGTMNNEYSISFNLEVK